MSAAAVPPAASSRGIAVEARDLVRVYRRRGGEPVRALGGVSLTVASGSCLALTGPSGCGKSTLLALLGALDRPTSGAVLHDGRDLTSASEPELARVRRGVGFVFQAAPMIRGLPVWENVTQGLVPRGVRASARRAAAEDVLGPLGVAFAAERRPEELSGGERQRVALARALVVGARLLLADEPTSQLDPASAAAVVEAIRGAHATGCTVVLASHDPALLAIAGEVRRM